MRPWEAPMDEIMRPHEPDLDEAPARTVSRRAFFNRTRLAVLAVAGAAVFGIGISTAGVTASEDNEKEKKKSEPRDKDRDTKEKEQDKNGKSSEKKSSTSNTKKKTKNTNGDTGKKKQQQQQQNDPIASSPYGKYVVDGKDQYGCTNFASQAEAQAVLRLAPKDPNNLDSNRNGIACDGFDAFGDGVNAGLMQPPFDFSQVSRSQPSKSQSSKGQSSKSKQ
jgi:hypothetical protein